jgi:hypothetical protein
MKGLIMRRDRLLWATTTGYSGFTSQRMLDEWQKSWEVAETGRFSHSIFPRVSLRPWFEEWRVERKLITTVSRILSGHCGVKAHLKRFAALLMEACVCV